MPPNPHDVDSIPATSDASYTKVMDSSFLVPNSSYGSDILNKILMKTIYYIKMFIHLFFQRKFIVHRLMGLLYLIQYALTFYLFFKNYNSFKDSILIWSLPLTGLIQSITAIFTFTFLSRTKVDSGYSSDRGTLSYPFIIENSFFSSLLLFQWLYYSDKFYPLFNSSVIIDNALVFLPYIARQLWPKTSFRDSIYNADKSRSAKNQKFFVIVTYITKWFYVWAKHYIGFFLNYVRFFNRANDEEIYYIYLLLIFSAFATTIAVFLHTLKFKGYLGPRQSFIIYMISYMATFYSFIRVRNMFIVNIDLTLYVFVGLVLNFTKYQHAYQIFLMVLFNAHKHDILPSNITNYLFLSHK